MKVDGKFLEADGSRFFIKGASYGTFAPGPAGTYLPSDAVIKRDFEAMAEAGINTVRIYTPPDEGVLDLAAQAGLRLMIGLPWAQHVAFLADRRACENIRREVRERVRSLGGHPAALLFAVGNEIPPEVVRWHGRHRVEAFLCDLYDEAKSVAPDALMTYVNYPPTEYLDTSPFDVCAFNIYLHDRAAFASYLARVQHIAGQKPLLIAELGGDSQRLTEEGQAALVTMQLRTAFREGACGAVVFSWTDEWWKGGQYVHGWKFGLVDEQRAPKLALRPAMRVLSGVPFRDERQHWPKVSVVVCGYNAADTIDECLASLERLDYPDYEVIFVNDGSTDGTGVIASRYESVKVIESPNAGLAAARNLGLAEACGEIVAYTDADVRVDPAWLAFLVQPMLVGDVVGSGGPNVVPEDNSWVAQCVARSPGSPTHVLLDDITAEHVPGCNMAFRREALLAIGGFDPTFIKAGDDVDLCWRLQARGWRIGFAPAALVWHHHRRSARAYYRQQVGYGEGETWLMSRHPSKFLRGRILWAGHIYSPLPIIRSLWESQLHTGPLGRKAFPSVYRTSARPLAYLPHSGRWMAGALALVLAGLVAMAAGISSGALAALLGTAGFLLTVGRCVVHSLRSDIRRLPPIDRRSVRQSAWYYRSMIAWLHFLQPVARVHGRIRGLLVGPPNSGVVVPRMGTFSARDLWASVRVWRWMMGQPIEQEFWGAQFTDPHDFCRRLVRNLRSQRFVRSITVDDGWREDYDLNIESGWALRVTVRILVEDHGASGSLCRVAVQGRPRGRCVAAAGVAVGGVALAGVPITPASLALLAAVLTIGMATTMARSWRVFRHACVSTVAELGLHAIAPSRTEPVPGSGEAAAPPSTLVVPAASPLTAGARAVRRARRLAAAVEAEHLIHELPPAGDRGLGT